MIEPGGGLFTYGYNGAAQLVTLKNPEGQRTTWSYDGAGRDIVTLLANGSRASYVYDGADRLVLLANLLSVGATLSSFQYTYDPVGNKRSVVEANGDRTTWAYDQVYRLTREQRSGFYAYTNIYSYDDNGNRITEQASGSRTTYLYDAADQFITSQDGNGLTTYTFDRTGNLTFSRNPANQRTTYIWNAAGVLSKLYLNTGIVNIYTYDGDGKRVQKQGQRTPTY